MTPINKLTPELREQYDADYERSTRFPQPVLRTNLARRHRFDAVNRPLDEREFARLTAEEREEALERERRFLDDQDAHSRMIIGALAAGAALGAFFALLAWVLFQG